MLSLYKISEISRKYNVTSRTLRYYEEIGLLDSIRDEDTKYRYYHESSLKRLEQIIALRNLQLSIKDIQEIFEKKDVNTLLQKLKEKSKDLNLEIDSKEVLKRTIDKLLLKLGKNILSYEETFELFTVVDEVEQEVEEEKSKEKMKEELEMAMNSINKLDKNDVRIIKLQPFKVAYYRAESNSPETDAWDVLLKYIKENKLDEIATTRYFGFNNPNPSEGNPVYGYEVWVSVDDDIKESEEVKIKEVSGGLYAVTMNSVLAGIGDRWRMLGEWVGESEYDFDDKVQWLEEHIILDIDKFDDTMQMDLYCPVKKV